MIFFNRKVNIIVYSAFCIFVAVCVIGIININAKYPQATPKVEYGSLDYMGCTIEAMGKRIYKVQEFCDANPDNLDFKYLLTSPRDISHHRVIEYTVNITNNNIFDINVYKMMLINAVAKPTYWYNGGPIYSSTYTLKPNESCVVKMYALWAPVLVRDNKLDSVEDNEFSLVFANYPEKIELIFE